MSADIEKLAVFDDRIVQTRPKYAVEKGALSLTNAPFNAIAQTQTQHTYNIYVPSENVYVDRSLDWSSTCFLRIDVQCFDSANPIGPGFLPAPAPQFPSGLPLLELGADGSLAALPLNSLCATLTATINDTTVVINSQDVLKEVLRLTDYKQNRLQRTCPTMLDKYQRNVDGVNATNDPVSSYINMSHDYHEVPNGAWNNIVFTQPTGQVLVGNGTYTFNGVLHNYINGVPVSTDQAPPAASASAQYSVFIKFRTTEKIVLSPFIFADACEHDTGLFGINNIQLVMNLRDPTRAVRLRDSVSGTSVKQYYSGGSAVTPQSPAVFYNTGNPAGVFADSVVNAQFLTPSLDIPLPPKSVVPYMEFPRYITQGALTSGTIAAGQPGAIQSQTITLPQIPDLLIMYVKAVKDPSAAAVPGFPIPDPTLPQFGDAYLPILTSQAGLRAPNPLTINFDNFSGLLSSHTAEQLYQMSVKNGLEVDWNTWSGLARTTAGAVGGTVSTVGGFLVLKPSQDITLQSGQAPSLVGNFTLQFNLQVLNTFPFSVTPQLFVITVNSGYFETIRGSSRIIKGVLSEQDIISAPVAPMGVRGSMKRMVGGASFLGSLGNAMRRAGEIYSQGRDIYEKAKPIAAAIKPHLPAGAQSMMSAVGLGGRSGGRSGGGKKSLRERLM